MLLYPIWEEKCDKWEEKYLLSFRKLFIIFQVLILFVLSTLFGDDLSPGYCRGKSCSIWACECWGHRQPPQLSDQEEAAPCSCPTWCRPESCRMQSGLWNPRHTGHRLSSWLPLSGTSPYGAICSSSQMSPYNLLESSSTFVGLPAFRSLVSAATSLMSKSSGKMSFLRSDKSA